MNKLIEKDKLLIENMIYEIRELQVMLDSDIAKLYQVETKRINEAVKNNPNKFPERFCFTITDLEKNNLWSKISTANISSKSRSNPKVFTEQGVYMLATILKSKVATEVSISIMDAFVKMRKYFANNTLNNEMLINHENRILRLEKTFDKFNNKKEINKIFFEGELYDAYSLLLDILNKANEEIIIIDNYAGKELLDILKDINKKIIIVSKNIDEILKKKYESQYSNITFINNDSFHDRFIILDRNKLYSCGASFKDLGKNCFAINEFNNKEYLNILLKILDV